MNEKLLNGASQQQLEPFLAKITADRDHELQCIAARLKQDLINIRRRAYTESRAFYRQQASRTRQQQQQKRAKALAKARTAIRRQRWHELQRLQSRAVTDVMANMTQAWRDAGRQQAWCMHWLHCALEHAGGAPLTIRLGGGALQQTQAALSTLLENHPAAGQIDCDADGEAGIIIEWNSTLLDGSLAAQLPRVEEVVFAALTRYLHDDNANRDTYEPR